ncbi:hypothetical protein ACA910_004957 [Epithemia clementina (nom. ined.)]
MVRVSLFKVFERSDDSRRLLASASDDVSLFPDEGEYKPPPGLTDFGAPTFGAPNPAEEEHADDFGFPTRHASGSSHSTTGESAKRSSRKVITSSDCCFADFGVDEELVTASPTLKTKKSSRRASTQNGSKGNLIVARDEVTSSIKSERKVPERKLKRAASVQNCIEDSKSSSELRSTRKNSKKTSSSSSKSDSTDEANAPKRHVPKRGLARRSSTGNLGLTQDSVSKSSSKKDKNKPVDSSKTADDKERKRSMRRSSTGEASFFNSDNETSEKTKKSSSGNHSKLGSSNHSKLGSSNHGKLGSSNHGKLGASSHSRRLSTGRDSHGSTRRKSASGLKGVDALRSKRTPEATVPEHSAGLSPPSDTEDEDHSNNNTSRKSKTVGKNSRRQLALDDDDSSFAD